MDIAIEIFGLVTGLLYLWYEIKHSNKMWYVGIVIAIVYTYLFAKSHLYASMSYQIYYLLMSIYGIYKWKKDANGISAGEEIIINEIKLVPAVVSSVLAFGLFLLIYFGLSDYTNAEQPLLDALVTSLSLLATYWLGNSWIGQWWIWVTINILSVIMFWRQNLYPTAFLYGFYGVSAIYGYYYWRKEGLYRNNL